MKLTFHGAARTVTGSKHMVNLDNGENILLDCGMFQGMGSETDTLNEHFGFNPLKVSAMILSHAHIDHSGLIPRLVKEGFSGKIFCTPATRELTEILLYDSAEIQTYETDYINSRREKKGLSPYEPLYTSDDVAACLEQFETVEYDVWKTVAEGVEVLFTNAGHLIGSAAVTLKVTENGKTTTVLFSGDIGKYRSTLFCPPAATPQADYIIMESTYGDKYHDIAFNNIETLHKWIQRICVDQQGQLVIPAFSVGRTQEILYTINQLSLEKRLPDIPVYIDSPLSLKATETIKKYTDQFNERLQKVLEIDDDPFHFPGLNYVESVSDSRKLVDFKGPCIIISASGTADAGRVRHHLNHTLSKKHHAVLFAGYCGAKSLGGELLSGAQEIEIFSDTIKVEAEIGLLSGMSAHGDCDDLCRFLSEQNAESVKQIFLVHGEYSVQQEFAKKLEQKGLASVIIPDQHEQFALNLKTTQAA